MRSPICLLSCRWIYLSVSEMLGRMIPYALTTKLAKEFAALKGCAWAWQKPTNQCQGPLKYGFQHRSRECRMSSTKRVASTSGDEEDSVTCYLGWADHPLGIRSDPSFPPAYA